MCLVYASKDRLETCPYRGLTCVIQGFDGIHGYPRIM